MHSDVAQLVFLVSVSPTGYFFFFQAEDGIRDDLVTGVQTCALPILSEIPAVRIGQEIAFRVDGFGSRTFKGKVERINPSADAGSRAISVFVSIEIGRASCRERV